MLGFVIIFIVSFVLIFRLNKPKKFSEAFMERYKRGFAYSFV